MTRMRIGVPVLVLLLALAGSAALLLTRPARGMGGQAPGRHAMHAMAMDERGMARMAAGYWATHAPVGLAAAAPALTAAASETVHVQNFLFDHDGNVGTQVDTVKVPVGTQVVWKWINGTHTVTNGTGSADPNSGTLFDAPADVSHTLFAFTFNSPGTFPYYCFFHEGFNMKGVVLVQDLTGVDGSPMGTGIGFASRPWPNPALAAVAFRYDVRQAGRVRAEVLDARGRRVAVVVDELQAAGRYTRTWDARVRGAQAPAGRYFLRLELPGYAGAQAITLAR